MKANSSVSLLEIYSNQNSTSWNKWLTVCAHSNNWQELVRVYYGLQQDMSELAKKKLNFEKVNIVFVRLTRSIEKTLKKMWQKNHGPFENIELKRQSDINFENWLATKRF